MRKITGNAVAAFTAQKNWKSGNTEVQVIPQHGGGSLVLLNLHGNTIARHESWNGKTFVTNCGWESNTTKERLNGLPGVSICQMNWNWYLNGQQWDGKLIEVK